MHRISITIGRKVAATFVIFGIVFGSFGNSLVVFATVEDEQATTTENGITESMIEEEVEEEEVQLLAATSTDGTGHQTGGTVFTGDAAASTTVENELNTNEANDVDSPGETNSSTITAENENDGELHSVASTTAETGVNTAEGGEGDATIGTGDALATADVVNVINTNIFNSAGLILFLNLLFGSGLDLTKYDLSYFFGNGTSSAECTILTCLNSSQLNVLNTNTATVTNDVHVRAATGENTATTTGDGNASIDTGNAYAIANILNLINTNIINSNYLLVSFNNFGDLTGNIVLPASEFFTQLLSLGSGVPDLNSSTYDVDTVNDVQFTGTTTANALTGENTATTTGEGAGEITTGNAFSNATTLTEANNTLIGGTSVFFLFRVWGDWTGTVTGLPEGMSMIQTPLGFMLVSDTASSTPGGAGEFNSSAFLAAATNTAHVENNVLVEAETGANIAATEDGTAMVDTGDAYAVANVLNLINTTMVGHNWLFAVFNIFGNWSGDVVFGGNPAESVIDEMDEVVVVTSPPSGGGGGGGGGGPIGLYGTVNTNPSGTASPHAPKLSVQKFQNTQSVVIPGQIDFTVDVINNNGAGTAYDAVLVDTHFDPLGHVLFNRSWELGDVLPGEKITLRYSLDFTASSTPGTYRSVARVSAKLGSPQGSTISAEDSGTLEVLGSGSVLGVSALVQKEDSCSPLLHRSLRPGMRAADVRTLQAFLNTHGGARLPVTNFFGPMTTQAVRVFQERHSADILAPWNLSRGTGLVYNTTLAKVNSLACANGFTAVSVPSSPIVQAPSAAPAPAPRAPRPRASSATPSTPAPSVQTPSAAIVSLPEPVVVPAVSIPRTGFLQKILNAFGR